MRRLARETTAPVQTRSNETAEAGQRWESSDPVHNSAMSKPGTLTPPRGLAEFPNRPVDFLEPSAAPTPSATQINERIR
jgi:hypothetical protein